MSEKEKVENFEHTNSEHSQEDTQKDEKFTFENFFDEDSNDEIKDNTKKDSSLEKEEDKKEEEEKEKKPKSLHLDKSAFDDPYANMTEEQKKAAMKNAEKNKDTKGLFAEIEAYGYHYSMKDFIMRLLLIWAIVGVASWLYKLWIPCIIILAIFCGVLVPIMIKAQFRYRYEHEKFDDVGDYLQQLATSFLKTKKIRDSLEETAVILNGRRIYDTILESIDYLDNQRSETLFEDAFAIIEEEYGCEKMQALHKFLIQVEQEGGEFEDTLNLMINDNALWIQRTYKYQGRRQSTTFAVLMGIAMAIAMCGILNTNIPSDLGMDVSDGETISISLAIDSFWVYQLTSTLYLAAMVGIYTLTQTVLQGSWLVDKGVRKDKEIIKDYRYYKYFDLKEETKKYALWFVVLMIVAAVVYFMLNIPVMAAMFAFIGVFYLTMPKRKLKSTKKRLERDLQKAFPAWVRDVSIALNNQTVQNAIISSEEKTPTVMKPGVRQLIEDFTADPISYLPWANFLAEFDVPEVKSASRMFFSINELSGESAKKQINILINRNTAALQEAEEKKADDEMTTLGYLVALPLGISVFKLIADLFMLLIQFMSITSLISQILS